MEQKEALDQYIIDQLTGKITLGYYRPGAALPPLRVMASDFGVPVRTVQLALRRLVSEGLVGVNLKGEALVSPPCERKIRPEEYAAQFMAKRDALRDFRENLCGFWADLLLAAIRLCGEEELGALERLIPPGEPSNGMPFFLFYQALLGRLGNSLLDGLFWDVVLYAHFDYPANYWGGVDAGAFARELCAQMRELLRLRRAEDWDGLGHLFRSSYRDTITQSLAMLENLTRRGLDVPQRPYRWYFRPSQPQPGFAVATDLMRRSRTGEFRPGEYLPSCAQLAEEYGVTPITIRQAIALTNKMRVTESINGKGTRLLPEEQAGLPDVSSPSVRRNLTSYLESLQLVALTCAEPVRRAFPRIPAAERFDCARRLRASCEAGWPIVSALPARLAARFGGSPAIAEIYSRLTELLAWGNGLRFADPARRRTWEPLTLELAAALEAGDAGRFAAGSERMYRRLLQRCGEWMRSAGIGGASALAEPAAKSPNQ